MSPNQPSPILVLAAAGPDALTLAPVVLQLREAPDLRPVVVVAPEHADLADETLAPFGLAADRRVELPRLRTWSQASLMARLLPELDRCVAEEAPAAVVVQGGTAGAMAGALASFWHQVPVVHVEAGLRQDPVAEPFPDEGYRRMISRLAAAHLAPTPGALDHLLAEGIDPRTATCTGSPVVDAAHLLARAAGPPSVPGLPSTSGGRLALLTVHRRESWGEPLRRILGGVRDLLDDEPDLEVVVPLPPNPLVRDVVTDELADHARAVLVEPLPHAGLLALLARADVVLTDSGILEAAAPTFGTPVVVLRGTTERPESVAAGTAWLVGADPTAMRHRTQELLRRRRPEPSANPFGDGHAAARVVDAVRAVVAGTALAPGWVPTVPDARASGRGTEPGRTRRLVLVRSDGDDENPPPPLRQVLSPPDPIVEEHPDTVVGRVVEIRRAGQILRRLPGLALDVLTSPDTADPWLWSARQEEGVVWLESAGPPVQLLVPGGRVVVRDGAASSRRDARAGVTTVTVLAGQVEVHADRGDALALAPGEGTTVHRLGTLDGAVRVPPTELADDPWLRANRALSDRRPAHGRLATDPLAVLAEAGPRTGRGDGRRAGRRGPRSDDATRPPQQQRLRTEWRRTHHPLGDTTLDQASDQGVGSIHAASHTNQGVEQMDCHGKVPS